MRLYKSSHGRSQKLNFVQAKHLSERVGIVGLGAFAVFFLQGDHRIVKDFARDRIGHSLQGFAAFRAQLRHFLEGFLQLTAVNLVEFPGQR